MMKSAQAWSQIGWIGVGKMGNPMAMRLVEAGYNLIINDPIAENRANLVARGAHVMALPEDIAEHCQIIFSMIPNDNVLNDLVYGTQGSAGLLKAVKAGTIFVEMSTVSPNMSERIAEDLSNFGASYLRCPVSGSTLLARTGDLTILGSGEAEAWKVVLPIIDILAKRTFYLGQGEEARYMKLVLNMLVGATSSILGEAMLLGGKGGLSTSSMMDVIVESVVASPLIRYKQDMLAQMDFTPAFSILQMIKDMQLITKAGQDKNVPMFIANQILQQYEVAANVGYAERDFFSLFDWMRTSYGLR